MEPFVTQPYLLSIRPATEMQVVWIQRSPAAGTVEYGSSRALGRVTAAVCYELTGLRGPASEAGYAPEPEENPPLRLWQCIASIGGLKPGERVYYRCRSGQTMTQVYHFHTAPLPGEPFRFGLVSDLQATAPCEHTVRCIGRRKPDFLLYSGDCTFHSWRADQWFDLQAPWQDEQSRRRAFFPCMQQTGGAQLMQFCPTFLCPGNHEVDDLRVGTDPAFAVRDEQWSWSIYMQLFRPLYPEGDAGLHGKRWYSVDYGDMHITSLHIARWARWEACQAPGWRLTDPIAPGSPQRQWLEQDLAGAGTKFKWVIQHWHLLNKGTDTQVNLCQPVADGLGRVAYPEDLGAGLQALYEARGVNAVSYGHSHVYERYYHRGVHYIEAAYLGGCCREANAPLHPSGLKPVVEDNSRQSFLMVQRTRGGLFAQGSYAGETPRLFDAYQIADEDGKGIPPI